MSAELLAATAASVKPGDAILVHPKIGVCVVAEVDVDEQGRIWIAYFKRGEMTYENKARAPRGSARDANRLVVRGLKPHQPDDLLQIERGTAERADRMRQTLERDDAERAARVERRANIAGRPVVPQAPDPSRLEHARQLQRDLGMTT